APLNPIEKEQWVVPIQVARKVRPGDRVPRSRAQSFRSRDMPRTRARGWTLLGLVCLSYSLLMTGCNVLPAVGTNKTTPPELTSTQKQEGGRSAVTQASAVQTAIQVERIQPRTILHWTIVTRSSMPNQNSGWSVVGVDGTVEIGAFGSIQVAGLTVS